MQTGPIWALGIPSLKEPTKKPNHLFRSEAGDNLGISYSSSKKATWTQGSPACFSLCSRNSRSRLQLWTMSRLGGRVRGPLKQLAVSHVAQAAAGILRLLCKQLLVAKPQIGFRKHLLSVEMRAADVKGCRSVTRSGHLRRVHLLQPTPCGHFALVNSGWTIHHGQPARAMLPWPTHGGITHCGAIHSTR